MSQLKHQHSQESSPGEDSTQTPSSGLRRSLLRSLGGLPLLAFVSSKVAAADLIDVYTTYQTPDAFINEAFAPGTPPPPKVLDLDGAKQGQVSSVFGKPYPQSRLRYWRASGRSAWIFDDIGKDGYVPTTCGFLISNATIIHARVLIYRESRGQQVAEPSFLKQLIGSHASGAVLDRNVDNISGATLSVKMMQRMARTALMFDTLAA